MFKTVFIPLYKAIPQHVYRIFKIEHKNNLMLHRMLDLGITKNSKIQLLHSSPTGNLKAYRIKGTVIALRDQDAQKILVYKTQ